MADDEDRVTMPFKFVTAYTPSATCNQLTRPPGFDARFPNQNQTKHCWQNYVDYHKCILAKGEDFKPCRQFFLAYRSLCPSSWAARWDDQRENGTFPTNLEE
ncbi:hypothetical protein E4T52_07099 [Aureobasidium sp. EXF-3400]|nr:hypothetical protein E4T51_15481 [Aureobasidium sp. EXF-12344]KAI4777967.1 hypothetical protein E4T52_07099 [Aureobasidium sp. EXF-3400]